MNFRVQPVRRLWGTVEVPGDKSISHRAALFAALARGRSVITNFSTSADCSSTLGALRALGVGVDREGSTVRVEGAGDVGGATKFAAPAAPLDCGNSGTTMRLLVGVLAGQPFTSTLTGDGASSRREGARG